MVQTPCCAALYGRLSSVLSDLHRTALHFCFDLGPQDLLPFRHSIPGVRDAHDRYFVHYRGSSVLPASPRRPSLVVECVHQRWCNRSVCAGVLLLLLLASIEYEWHSPAIVLFWVHVSCLVWLFPYARLCWILQLLRICELHLWKCEDRLNVMIC